MPELAILIPAYNEEENIKKVLIQLKKFRVFVVNDGSSDKTLTIIKKFKNVTTINNKKNLGYEISLIKGFCTILKERFKYILTIDADGEHSLNKIKKFYNFAKKNNLDLIVGERSNFNRISEKFLSFFFYTRYKIKDPLSGFKLYNCNSLKKIIKNMKNDNTFLVSILYFFLKNNLKIKNLKILTSKRVGTRVGNNFCTNLKIVKLIFYCLV